MIMFTNISLFSLSLEIKKIYTVYGMLKGKKCVEDRDKQIN